MNKKLSSIKELLEERYLKYNNRTFVPNDPVSVPRKFRKKEDIEIAGLLAATISWGNRKSIIANAEKLVTWMDMAPHEFILNHATSDLKPFEKFVHRTFNGNDCVFFLRALQHIYINHGGLEAVFALNNNQVETGLKYRIANFRTAFFETKHLQRSEKHVSNPLQKSSAKRLCMFLRWMVRNDKKGVDFGIWKSISSAELCLPLDVHTGNVSRKLGLLKRKQNDWQAVEEITAQLQMFDKHDPVKYDFALFGLGVDKAI